MLIYPLVITSDFIQTAYGARGSDLDANKLALLMGDSPDTYQPHFFRTCPSDTRMADATALLIQSLGWNQVCLHEWPVAVTRELSRGTE